MSASLRDVFVVSVYDTHCGGEVSCINMHIVTQTYTIPVIAYGTDIGNVAALYGFENMTGDSTIRVTTWNTKYAERHSSRVLAVGIIESKVCINMLDLIFFSHRQMYLLYPRRVRRY